MAKRKEEPEQYYNCLRNERVIVRFVPKENAMAGNDSRHVLSGGMGNDSHRTYVVPMLRSGQLVNVLTDNEKEFLEEILGLESNALSIYQQTDNYWKKFRVTLGKSDNYLDLSQPIDYIKYKVLLANSDTIAPSIEALKNRPKATYQYVIVTEGEEVKDAKTNIDTTMEAYMEFGGIKDDWGTMRVIVENLTGRPVAKTMSIDSLANKVNESIRRNPKDFLRLVKDPMLSTKVLLRDCIEAGIVSNRGGQLFLREDGSPLCNSGEPTMNVAAAYLNEPKHNELKLMLEAKVKQNI